MDTLFQRFFGPTMREGGEAPLQAWSPRCDVTENDQQMSIKVDLPGVDPKDVDISFRDNILVVRGEKKEEHEEKNKNYHRMERFVGQFYREIPLPPGTDPEKIAAASTNGVVTITIPKKQGAQSKKITVKAEK
jgi:HSP20 family protein